jgi:hypothetical protein
MVLLYPYNHPRMDIPTAPNEKTEKKQLPEVQSHYGLFINEYSRMLRLLKLCQSMENIVES